MIKRNTSQICLWVGMVLMLAVSAKASTLDPGTWTQTGNLNFARDNHTATLLPNGKVLVAGGYGGSSYLVQSEMYDPATGTWNQTGNLNFKRSSHTATLLPNGKVLVAGGSFTDPDFSNWDNSRPPTTYYPVKSELYDPATGTWSQTGNLSFTRDRHTATLLPNGKVLVTGGAGYGGSLVQSELYDPSTGAWSQTGNPNDDRYSHTATLLPNGKVLVAGGRSSTIPLLPYQSELYDPATGTWSQTGNLNFARYSHTATLLPNGKVLVAGGYGSSSYLVQSELYNPATGTWTQTGNLNFARANHTTTLLPNGKVLVAGYRSAELFRSKTNAMPWLQLLLE
jgi:N-acetylneuraminic acid mutarotase